MADTKASSWLEDTGPKVHETSSGPGKFDNSFMGSDKNDDQPTAKPKHAAGSYPVAGGAEAPYAKPVHAPDTLIPKK